MFVRWLVFSSRGSETGKDRKRRAAKGDGLLDYALAGAVAVVHSIDALMLVLLVGTFSETMKSSSVYNASIFSLLKEKIDNRD